MMRDALEPRGESTVPQGDPTEADRVAPAAAALSPLERDVLAMSAGLNLSNDAIAARLGIGERRAERILSRALRKFDRAMRGERQSGWRFW